MKPSTGASEGTAAAIVGAASIAVAVVITTAALYGIYKLVRWLW